LIKEYDIDYDITPDYNEETHNAYILSSQLILGRPVIYLGGNIEEMDKLMKYSPDLVINPKIFDYETRADYLTDEAESIITHEVLHIVLYKTSGSIHVTRSFDDIDRCKVISGV